VAIQNKAIDDFLAGPEHIFSILETALPEVHRMRKEYPDAVILPAASELPPPLHQSKAMKPPANPLSISYRLARGILHNLKDADPAHHQRPEFNVPTQDARWFRLCTVDGVTVTTADGCGVVYRQRDRRKMFSLLFQSLRRQRRLANRFDEMRKVYRSALPVLSSKQKWETALSPASGWYPQPGADPPASQEPSHA
jgi:galactofuranosylgalactofuranosylrhamnosyl-N-acetylglucosaminyl-diphospho-decaprenol beta-1,5/1,6-galactofuranosyltransferase